MQPKSCHDSAIVPRRPLKVTPPGQTDFTPGSVFPFDYRSRVNRQTAGLPFTSVRFPFIGCFQAVRRAEPVESHVISGDIHFRSRGHTSAFECPCFAPDMQQTIQPDVPAAGTDRLADDPTPHAGGGSR